MTGVPMSPQIRLAASHRVRTGTFLVLVAATASLSGFGGSGLARAASGTDTTLSVSVTGQGTVTSGDGMVSCSSSCTQTYKPGTVVDLAAASAAGWTFSGWGDDCSGSKGCTLTMDVDHKVTATFTQNASTNASLSVSVTGQGTVTSGDGQLSCTSACVESYKQGTAVTLTATPDTGWFFAGWGDDCSGSKDCSITMDTDHKVTASFLYGGLGEGGGFSSDLVADGAPAGTIHVNISALVNNRPPRAVLDAPHRVAAGKTVVLSGRHSSDPDGRVEGWRWDLNGDGVFDDAFGPRATFRGASAGSDRVALEVIDNKGRVTQATRMIQVTGERGTPRVLRVLTHDGSPTPLRGTFTGGTAGWRTVGAAFAGPIQHADTVSASQVLDTNGRLGGSYADGVPVPVGASGGWVSSFTPDKKAVGLSANASGDLATGVLVSRPFKVDQAYLGYLLGGGGGFRPGDERVELWQRTGSGWHVVSDMTRDAGPGEAMSPVSLDVSALSGQTVALAVIDGSASGHVNVDGFHISTTAPNNADDTHYYQAPPDIRADLSTPPPIVGLADFHSHPEAAQGFGALNGIRAYMGTIGGNVALYDRDTSAYAHDVYSDDVYHFGGPLAKFGIDVAEGRALQSDADQALSSLVGSHVHPRYGGTCIGPASGACSDPGHRSGTVGPAHEQMNVYEIHRAWEGGLRLLSSLSINSSILEYMGGFPHRYDGGPPESDIFGAPTEHNGDESVNQVGITPEANVIKAQVEGMRELANLNSSWMQIAYSPQQAYDIMHSGKLAIILGTEIDTTGSLGFTSASDEVDWLWGLGIRQVTAIHCCDSKIGGAPAFQDAYNMANDFQNRPVKDVTALRAFADVNDQGLAIQPKAGFTGTPALGYFMHVKAGCEYPNDTRGECVNWRFDTPDGTGTATSPKGSQEFAVIDGNAYTDTCCHVGFTIHPAPFTRLVGHYAFYDGVNGGMVNTQGLTPYGADYIRALMSHGMLIDMEHMSEATINGVIDPGTTPGHVSGPVWAFDPNTPCSVDQEFNESNSAAEDCMRFAYPLMSSHTSYRAQSLLPGATTFKGFLSREFERSSEQLEYIRASGGVVGPVVLQDPVDTISAHLPYATTPTWQIVDHRDWPTTSTVQNSCAGSSESWTQAYLYSLQKMRGQGVGIGTDMVLVGGTSPRFGAAAPAPLGAPYACDASREAPNRQAEERTDPAQYQRSAQRNEVAYESGPPDPTGSARYEAAFAGLPGHTSTLREEVDPAGAAIDFNKYGMLRYGQLPDLLQDVHNIGVTPHDMAPLFSSAQDYLNMWDKAYTIVGCYGDQYSTCAGEGPTPLGDSVCSNTCPMDNGRGLGLAPDGTPYVFQPLGH